MVQRSKQPDAGLWGFPGGHVEWGETVLQAATRELLEETSVIAQASHYLDNLDLLRDDDGQVISHYLLVGVACRYQYQVHRSQAMTRWTPAGFPWSRYSSGDLPMSARGRRFVELRLAHGVRHSRGLSKSGIDQARTARHSTPESGLHPARNAQAPSAMRRCHLHRNRARTAPEGCA